MNPNQNIKLCRCFNKDWQDRLNFQFILLCLKQIACKENKVRNLLQVNIYLNRSVVKILKILKRIKISLIYMNKGNKKSIMKY